jgi:lysophosphatidate acyltransferase
MSLLGYFGAALTSILVSIPTLHLLASVTHAPVLSFAARSIASFSALIFCACYGVVASIVLRLVGYGGLSQWTTARAFKWVMWTLTGVEFVVTDKHGALKVRPSIMVGNHQTYVLPLLFHASSLEPNIDMASATTVNSTS